ncbi:hypothetical protein F0562_032388 [Nyssa sinensis]|uniref:MULE transposase domain-containing protein n=1 Tax=Nyssa sinensis TaxID=561372 RepID=A0A5J5ASJ0_9ASTE|nr:hypothetical protein F0562_032388 [Nyssa sinensis]
MVRAIGLASAVGTSKANANGTATTTATTIATATVTVTAITTTTTSGGNFKVNATRSASAIGMHGHFAATGPDEGYEEDDVDGNEDETIIDINQYDVDDGGILDYMSDDTYSPYSSALEKYGVEVSRMVLYRTKKMEMEEIEGNHGKSYAKIPMYANEVRKTNTSSLVKLEMERIPPILNLPTFKRLFFSLVALQKGFTEGCRPFLGLDGCHLKGPFGGVLLAVVALDGNNGLFPIAFAVVESETKDSWTFFLYHLHSIISDRVQVKPWNFMTDGQKDITRIPCKHAIASISYKRLHVDHFVDDCFSRDKYLKAYTDIIHPIHDEKIWEEVLGDEV